MLYSKQDLKGLIAKGYAGDVFHGIIAATYDLRDTGHLHQSATLLSARWWANEQAQLRGTLSNADYLLEKNKVTDTLLAIVGELPEGLIEVELSKSLKFSESSTWKKIAYVSLIVGILAGVVKIVEYFQKPPTVAPMEKTVVQPVSTPSVQLNVDNGDAIYAPGGTVNTSRSSEVDKTAEEKAKN